MLEDIEIRNDFLVGLQGDKVVILKPPRGPIPREAALRLAAWIVALADVNERFNSILQAVHNTNLDEEIRRTYGD